MQRFALRVHGANVVSIHARQYWRAMLPGEHQGVALALVSIHARQYWRAMPEQPFAVAVGLRVSIHARQYWRAMLQAHLLQRGQG